MTMKPSPRSGETDAAKILSASMVGVPLALATSVWRGYAVSVLWGWFVVPAFGAPPLGLWLATGLILLLRLMLPSNVESDRHIVILSGVFDPLLALGIGWVLKGLAG